MGQVTIYLDAGTERKMTKMVKRKGVSKSKWIGDLIRGKTATTWPDSVAALAGAWADLPTVEQIRKSGGRDAKRETL